MLFSIPKEIVGQVFTDDEGELQLKEGATEGQKKILEEFKAQVKKESAEAVTFED